MPSNPEILPALEMPPEKFETAEMEMPSALVAEIVPLLVIPPEKVEPETLMPVKDVPIVPLLVIPPEKVETPETSMAFSLDEMWPAFEIPPAKVGPVIWIATAPVGALIVLVLSSTIPE